jgi:hypothetical protein
MADDTILLPSTASRRQRLVEARRRRRRRVLVSSAVALVAVGSAGAFALSRDTEPAAKRASGPPAAQAPSDDASGLPQVKQLKDQAPPRAISHDDPLRLWVGGDSIAGAIGPALGNIAGATGVVKTQVDYRVSSGISNDGVRDWSTRAEEQMALYDPEAVVFEIGTNDASIVNSRTTADGVPEWEPQYRLQVARMMDTLRGDADDPRTVLWAGAPPMKTSWRDEGVRELNRVIREEAEKRAPDVIYVDTYQLLASETGEYTPDVRTLTGDVERVRISDGVHLTDAGAAYLGAVIFSLLDARWDVVEHADTTQPISWDESAGSGEGGGYSSGSSGRRGGSGSGSGSGSSGSSGSSGTTAAPAVDTTVPSATTVPASAPATSAPAPTVPTPASSTPASSP